MRAKAKIRKIVKGNFSYSLLQTFHTPAGPIKVVGIVEDIEWGTQYGEIRYNIYVETDEATRLWKSIPSYDASLEYDLSLD